MANDSPGSRRRSEFVLADDLSGALEVAACFVRDGRKVTLPLCADPEIPPAHGLLVLSSETRNASAEAARESIRAACGALRRQGATILFKKIDSTARGPVGAELEAVWEVFPEKMAVFCPANPAVGRTVVGGVLRVSGIEIADTPFRDDPRWPMRSSVVESIVDPEGAFPAASLSLAAIRQGAATVSRELDSARRDGRRIVYCDAETRDDLDALVSAVLSHPAVLLLVGSGGLGRVLAEMMPAEETVPPATDRDSPEKVAGQVPLPAAQGRTDSTHIQQRAEGPARPPVIPGGLYVVGSRHPASHAQLDLLRRRVGLDIFDFCGGAPDQPLLRRVSESLEARGRAGIRFGKEAGGASGMIENLAVFVSRVRGVSTLVATGGETAFAICRHLGVRALEVIAEMEPGVVATRADFDGRSLILVTKPGGFGDEETFARVHAWLPSLSPDA
ncbi:MAG: four-carbon acid sugar kinase family protein [Opitutaceae bacterium]